MKILKENKILTSLKESEDVKGLTIKEVAEKLFDGYLDMDVTDVDIDVLVAFVYEVGKQPEDSYDRFIDIMANRTKVVELNGDILVCDFTSVFKPYEKELQDFFDMDNSEFSEAYYEAVDNLEGLLSGFTGESTYKELCDILEGNKPEEVMNESEEDSDEIINPQDEAFANSIYDVYLWCGSGYALDKFRVFGICAEDALDTTVAYCEKESMSGLIYTMDEIEKDVKEIWSDEMAESGYDDWFDFATEYLNYIYVDATMVGASQPYFIHGEQFRIEEEEKLSESVEWDKVIDNDMSIKELDDTAKWLYKYERNEWDKFTDNELIELAKLCQISNENPWGRCYDDEVFDEMDRRGLSLNKTEGCKKKNKKSARTLKEATNDKITSEDLNNGVTLKCSIDGKEHIIYASWDQNFDFDEEVKSGNIPKKSNPEDWGGIIFEVNAVGEEYIDGGELVTNKDEFTATSLGSDLLDLIGSNGTDFELTSEVPKEEPEEKPKEKKSEGKTVTTEDLDSEGINYIFRGDVGNGDERLFINFALSSEGGIDYTIYREGGSEVDGGVMDVDTTKTWSSMDEVAKELVSFQGIKKAYSFIACDNGSADETLSQYGFINEAVREIKPRDRFDYGNNIKGDNYFLSYKTYKADPNSISFRKDGSVSVYAKYRTPDGKIREVMPTFEPGTTEEDLKKFADMLCKNGWDKTKKIINKKVNEAVTTSEPENATKSNKPGKVRNYLNYELEDDDTETGGVSFNGETVADFIGDTDIKEDDDLDKLNKALVSCGIRPIAEGYLTDYRGDDYWDLSDAYVNGSIDDRELAWELIKLFDSYDAAERAFKEITDGKKMPSFGEDFEDIKEITPDEANQLIGEWNNERNSVAKGRYLAQDGESKFIAIDNRTGDCWVEEFSNKGSAINWLEDKEEVNESLKESAAMDRVVLDAVKDYGITKVVSDEMKKEIKFTVPKANIGSRDDYSSDDPQHHKGLPEDDPRYDNPKFDDGYVCATIEFISSVEEALEDNGMRVDIFGEGESAVDGGTFTLTYEPRGIYEAAEAKKTGDEALQELVNKGVLQSVKSKKNSDNTVEYLIAYEIPMSVGSTDRVITADDGSLEALVRATKESANELGDDIYGSLTDENDFFGYDSKEEMEERIDDEVAILRNIATDLENMLGSSSINEDINIKPGNMSANFTFDKNNVITNFDPGFTPKLTPEEKKKTLNTLNSIKNEKRGFSGDFEEVLWYTGEYFTEEENNKFKEYLNKVGDEISRANGDNYGVTAYDVLPSVIKWVKSIETINEAVDEKGNFTACYSINGGEYALSILQKANEGGEADLLVKAKDGKGNSALLSGYDQIEGFEFTKDDEPFYSGATFSDEDIIALLKKFKPDYEVKSVERIPNKEVYKSMKESVKELDDFIDKHNLRGDLEKNDPANFMKSVDKVFSDNNLCYWCGRKIEGKPHKDKNGNPTCDKCYKELNESVDGGYTFKPGYHEWILAKNGKTISTYNSSTIDDMPDDSYDSIKDWVEGIVSLDDELENYNKEAIIDVMANALYSYYGNLNESDTGYDYWGPKSMERFDGPAFIQYYGGPGDMEYLQRARNGRYVWVNSANIGDPYTFDSYEDALEVQKQFGGEIIDYNREYLGKDDTDEE